jgi:hypothetical protein
MSTTPWQVVAALSEVLAIKARVDLRHTNGVPHAVIAGPSGTETWIDLEKGRDSLPGENAESIAEALIRRERWDPVNLGRLLSELGKLGFCDISHEIEKIRDDGPLTGDAFADLVITAEGLHPMTCDFRGRIRQIVSNNLGRGPI